MSKRRHCHYYGWRRNIRTGGIKSKGFTLLEVVIVLTLLMVGVGIGLPAYNAISVQKEEEKFFQLLRNDIYFAQSEAYRTSNPVKVIFRPEPASYIIVQKIYSPIVTREIPKSVTLTKNSNLTEITYWSSGSILVSGTLHFGTSTGERTIIVHLGKGRVVFSE